MEEFDFSIEHRPGKDNVVPHASSCAPLPISHPEVTVLVTPPSQASTFLVTLLGFDLCTQHTSTELQPLGNSLTYLNLACSTQNPLNATALPPSLHKQTSVTPCFTTAEDLPAADASPQLQEHLPKSTPWPDNFEQLCPLNFNIVEFVQKQCKDPWLVPLVQFLITDSSQNSINMCDQKVRKWVTSIAKRTKLIDGLLFYSDEFMKNPDHLCLFLPSDVELQCHILQSYHDSSLGMHRGCDTTYNAVSIAALAATVESLVAKKQEDQQPIYPHADD